MTPDDTGHDAASDLPWDDDAPLLPYPVIATDPDPGAPMPTFPGLPVSARWPDPSEDLAGLREFRADYDRLMSTEGQSHGEAIAALSGLVASVRQRPAPDDVDRRCAELREALTPTDDDGLLAREHIADMLALVDMIEMLNAENRVLIDRCDALADRVTAAEGRLELARTTPGPHIPPALMRRIEALGFVPGSGEPVGWLLGYVEGLAALLTTAQGERDELAATLANERVAWVDMREDVLRNEMAPGGTIEINDVLRKIDEYMPDACTEPAPEAIAGRSAGGGAS